MLSAATLVHANTDLVTNSVFMHSGKDTTIELVEQAI